MIAIPDPSLVVLVGAAGAGKSSLAARWFAPDEILSSDALRALLAGDPADQRASRAAFRLLHRTLAGRLEAGRLTVVDATNVRREARRGLVVRARSAGLSSTAIVLDLPPAVVHRQNAGRTDRVVPAWVVDRQLMGLRRTIARDELAAEGFGPIHRIDSTEALAAARLVRVAWDEDDGAVDEGVVPSR